LASTQRGVAGGTAKQRPMGAPSLAWSEAIALLGWPRQGPLSGWHGAAPVPSGYGLGGVLVS